MATQEKRLFKAVIWSKEPDQRGIRVSVFAHSLYEAKKMLEDQHGQDTVFILHNEEDENQLR